MIGVRGVEEGVVESEVSSNCSHEMRVESRETANKDDRECFCFLRHDLCGMVMVYGFVL